MNSPSVNAKLSSIGQLSPTPLKPWASSHGQEPPKVSPNHPRASTARPKASTAGDFQSFLQDRLRVSGHASTRLQSRKLELGQPEWDRVMGGIDKAAEKGARESLVMVDDVALVVSVKNRTVITALDKAQLRNNVFTNIDSAVIV